MNQPGKFGEDFPWLVDGARAAFKPGTWHHVRHHLRMNTAGAANGIVEGWFDGVLALERRDVRFRASGATFAIDAFYFSTFFGGNGEEWAPDKNEYVYFDDFVIWSPPPAALGGTRGPGLRN